ncbi:MAG: biotin/lipoate A/B protein ligase family protein [Nitrospirota bacterium]
MQIWRLIDSGPERASLNMAIDEAIAESVAKGLSQPTIRFYEWRPPAVSIGYFQKIEEIDQRKCLIRNYDIVRRPTGGRAILHNRELTYSVMFNTDNPVFSTSVMDTYKIIHQGLLIGLKKLELMAGMVSGREKRGIRSSACFFSPSIYELTVGGKKIIGSAQRRWQKVVLQQGSILLDLDIEGLFTILSQADRESFIVEAAQKMTSINKELGRAIEINKVKKVMEDGFEDALGISLQPDVLTDYETVLAFKLSREKYSNPDWNYKR